MVMFHELQIQVRSGTIFYNLWYLTTHQACYELENRWFLRNTYELSTEHWCSAEHSLRDPGLKDDCYILQPRRLMWNAAMKIHPYVKEKI